MIDQAKKRLLIENIKRREASRPGEILLEPELFFDGYDDDHCTITANGDAISTARFLERLKEVGRRTDVSTVWVRFYDYLEAVEFEDCWIGSDSIYVLTTASPVEVQKWFEDFDVTETWEEKFSKFPDVTDVPNGFRLIAVWWD